VVVRYQLPTITTTKVKVNQFHYRPEVPRGFQEVKVPSSGVPRRGGEVGVFNPTPRNSEGPPKSCQIQPDCENLKIAEFRTPTLQDVRKKGSKILKLPSVRNCFTLAMTNKLVCHHK